MSFSPETLCLHRLARMSYLSLPTPKCQVTYIWINHSGTVAKSKTLTLDYEPQSVQDLPHWFATSPECNEIELVPVRMFRDPFTLDPNKLVLCEVQDLEGNSTPGQRRSELEKVMEAVKEQKPWFGFEQEFVLMTLDGRPFGCKSLNITNPESAVVGLDRVFGRDVSLSHYKACLYAGIKICGITCENMRAQWEFQIGPCGGTELGDHVWTARYILYRVCEDFGLVPSLDAKPLDEGKWFSAGHMNFSTEVMRSDGGLQHIYAAVERLSRRHAEHMAVYGERNELRLHGEGFYSTFSEFTSSTGGRKCSVRVPGYVHREGRGYLEDRRPAASCDPYEVCKALAETCLLLPSDGQERESCRETQSESSLLLPAGGENSLLLPAGGENSLLLPAGGESRLLLPAGGESSLLPPAGGENSLLLPAGGESSLLPPAGGESSLLPPAGGENSLLLPAGV